LEVKEHRAAQIEENLLRDVPGHELLNPVRRKVDHDHRKEN